MSNISFDKTDWANFYSAQQIRNWQLPMASEPLDWDRGIFRDLYISWASLKKSAPGSDPTMWFLFCDVLDLGEDMVLNPSTAIFARRIEVGANSSLILNRLDTKTPD